MKKVFFYTYLLLLFISFKTFALDKETPKNEFNILKNGSWSGEVSTQHKHDPRLELALIEFFQKKKIKTILDLGAGKGHYTEGFIKNGFFASCYDGNPNTQNLSNGRCGIIDLTKEINFSKYEWVLSLEVGEHLPKEFEDVLLNNLINNSTHGIVLSWAIPGQGGDGHVNEQTNEYIKNKMRTLGYIDDPLSETELRNSSSLSWFKNTIMVFIPMDKKI